MSTYRNPSISSNQQPRPGRDAGFTLLAVVAVVFLLSLVVVTLMRQTSALLSTARSAEEHAAAEAMSDGIARLVARHLSLTPLDETRAGNLPTTGLPAYCRAGGMSVTIAVVPEYGRIDLNAAPVPLLQFILKGAGLSEDKATEIANDIADFRSPGEASLTGDEKWVRYRAAGRSFGAKSAPFASVLELDQIPALSRALFNDLKPLFTVQSGRFYIDPLRASYPVTRALNGLGLAPNEPPFSEDQLLRLRHETVLPQAFKVPAKTRAERRTQGSAFHITVTSRTQNGAIFQRELTTSLEPGSHEQGRVLEWVQGSISKAAVPPSSSLLPACVGELLSTTE